MCRVLSKNVLVMIIRVTTGTLRGAALLCHNVRKQWVRIINVDCYMIHCLRTIGQEIIIWQLSWMFGWGYLLRNRSRTLAVPTLTTATPTNAWRALLKSPCCTCRSEASLPTAISCVLSVHGWTMEPGGACWSNDSTRWNIKTDNNCCDADYNTWYSIIIWVYKMYVMKSMICIQI